MPSIEVRNQDGTPRNTEDILRDLHEKLEKDSLAKAASHELSLQDRLNATDNAAFYGRMAQDSTLSEPQVEHTPARRPKGILHKLGATAFY